MGKWGWVGVGCGVGRGGRGWRPWGGVGRFYSKASGSVCFRSLEQETNSRWVLSAERSFGRCGVGWHYRHW